MSPPALLSTPAVRRQNLLVEFASLKHAAPAGVYMSLTSPDPTLWSGIIFVRKGPYHGGIFKFTISFPATYPSTAPTIVFQTPIYHPLISPLLLPPHMPSSTSTTTTTTTTPGFFSLRHGFPAWFIERPAAPRSPTPTLDLLQYVKASLSEPDLLDAVPLSAAENGDAWRRWSAGEGGRGVAGGWEERVRDGVERSAEAVYGREGPVRFVELEEGMVEGVKEVVKCVVEESVVLV